MDATFRYGRRMPPDFQFIFVGPRDEVKRRVDALMDVDKVAKVLELEMSPGFEFNGTSFAVTSDAAQGETVLWLSGASATVLRRLDLSDGMEPRSAL